MIENNVHTRTNIDTFSNRSVVAEFEWQKDRIEKVCSILRGIENKKVGADIGCHSGLATALYANTGIEVLHGFDVSEVSLNNLRTRGFEGFNWNIGSEPCPMPDNTYDIIIAGEIIEHIINTDSFVLELYRILKPGGHLIVTTPNLVSWYNRIRLLRGLVPTSYPGVSSTIRKDNYIDFNHIRVNVLSEWVNLLEQYGFQVKTIQGTSWMQVLQGGWRTKIVKLIDRWASNKATMAVNLVLLLSKPLSDTSI